MQEKIGKEEEEAREEKEEEARGRFHATVSTGWLAGTNVSDIIYDMKCSVPALTLPLLYLPLCVSGSGRHTCKSLINTFHS